MEDFVEELETETKISTPHLENVVPMDQTGVVVQVLASLFADSKPDLRINSIAHGIKVKPWDKERNKHTGKSLRIKLESLDSQQKEVQFVPSAHARILLRLERTMGDGVVCINNIQYMRSLEQKIHELEEEKWCRRKLRRSVEEKERFRNLVIEGYAEPESDMEGIQNHPIYRMNRIMRAIKKLDFSRYPQKKLPEIQPLEPFDEYFEKGVLFGWHQKHFLKVGTLIPRSSIIRMRRGFSSAPAFEYKKHKFSNSIDESIYIPQTISGKKRNEMGGEINLEEVGKTEFDTFSDPDPEIDLETLLGHTSLVTITKDVLGVDLNELDAKFSIRISTIVEKLFKDDPVTTETLFAYANQVNSTYRRKMMKADKFITNVHRKITKLNNYVQD